MKIAGKQAKTTAYGWAVVGMLWFVCFFNYADRQAIFSVFPLLRNELHLSTLQLGIVGSSFMWMYALFGPLAGWLCDRFSRKGLVLGGLIFWSAVTGATALAHSYSQLVLCRALGGLGEAVYFPASMSLIAEYHGSQTRSRAMAIHQSSVYAGTIAGGTVSGYVAQNYGWRNSFVLLGGLGCALGLLLWMFVVEPMRGQSETVPEADFLLQRESLPRQIADLLQRPLVLSLIGVFVGANFVAVVFLTWLPSFLFEKFHMSLAMSGLNGTAYLQVASVLGVLSGGVLADTLAKRGTAWRRSGRMATQAIGLLCGVPFLFVSGQTRFVPLLLISLAGFGYFKGLYDANLWAALYDVVPLRARGTAVGLMNSIGWLGGGMAPIAIAALAQRYSLSTAVSATALVYLAGAALMVWGARRAMHQPVATR